MSWSPEQYTKFEDERNRPVLDLIARIPTTVAASAADIGCGTGNSTEILQMRFPAARITAMDSSPEMIAAARKRLPAIQFEVEDIVTWRSGAPLDVILANAVLQWVPDHASVLPALVEKLTSGGSLAVQMPDNLDEPAHCLMRELAQDGPWAAKLSGASASRATRQSAEWYYRTLRASAKTVDIWRTTYHHLLPGGAAAVIEWFKGTGLRPFLDPLDETERASFLCRYQVAIADAYPVLSDGAVLLPFPGFFSSRPAKHPSVAGRYLSQIRKVQITPGATAAPDDVDCTENADRVNVVQVLNAVSRSRHEKTPQAIATVPSLQERKQALVRDTIWEAAIDLFAEKGFDETTVDDIAQAAGTSRRSFFRYFESKSDLMAQPIVSYGTSLTDAIKNCPQTYSPAKVFRHTVLAVARKSASHPRTRKVMEIAAKYPGAREAQIARVAEVQDQVAEAYARRYKKHSKDQTAAHVLAALTLSILGVTYRTWFESGQPDIAVTVEQILATLCDVTCGAAVTAHKDESHVRRSKAGSET